MNTTINDGVERHTNVYEPEQLQHAMLEVLKRKLVWGWTGCLKVEYCPDDKKLHLTQYLSASQHMKDCYTLWAIENEGWSDFLFDCGVADYIAYIKVDYEQWKNYESVKKAPQRGEYAILSSYDSLSEFFNEIEWDDVLALEYQNAEQRLLEVTRKEDKEEE